MTNNSGDFEAYFDHCLDLIKSGQADLDSAVALYPEHSQELRARLKIALWFDARKGALNPRPEFVARSRQRLVSQISQRKPTPVPWLERLRAYFATPTLAPVAFVVMLLFLLVLNGTVVSISENALPGDRLYATKLILEDFALATSLDQANDTQLQIHFVRRRLLEVNKLLVERRYENVDESVKAYENEVNQTINSITALAYRNTAQAQLLAIEFQKVLDEQEPILTQLSETVPASVMPSVSRAVVVSHEGKEAAQEMSQIVPPRNTSTPVPLPTSTPFPTRTSRPAPTSAPTLKPLPTEEPDAPTPVPTFTASATSPPPTPVPTATRTPEPPTEEPTSTPVPTDTPTPTATPTNTPTDTPVPTATPTATPSKTPFFTNTPTPTDTSPPPTATPTASPVPPTNTPVPTQPPPTATPTSTPLISTNPTATATALNTPLTSIDPTPTPTPTP